MINWIRTFDISVSDPSPNTEDGVPYEDLRPTLSHEVISSLIEAGLAHFVISQNCDDLHGLAGIPGNQLAELHGNVFVERCEGCGQRYRRQNYVLDDAASEYFETTARARAKLQREKHWKQCRTCGLCHRTGRNCDNKVSCIHFISIFKSDYF